MSDIDILLFHEAYENPPRFEHVEKLGRKRSRTQVQGPPVSLDAEVIEPLIQKGIIARTLSLGLTKWQGIARIPMDEESDIERLNGVKTLEGRFKRMDIRCCLICNRIATF